MLPDRPKGYTFNEVISPDTTRNVELKRIADALEKIADAIEQTVTATISTEDIKKAISHLENDESYPPSQEDIKVVHPVDELIYRAHEEAKTKWTDEQIKHSRENPDPLDVAEEG